MLGSRLSWKDQIKMIDKSTVKLMTQSIQQQGFNEESYALLAGGKLQADYVIIGSLTILGNSTSIDSKLIDVSGKQQPMPFSTQTSDLGSVIPAINQFATTINETVFRRSAPTISLNSNQHSGALRNPSLQGEAAVSTRGFSQNSIKKNHTQQGTLNPNFTLSSGNTQPIGNKNLPNSTFSAVKNTEESQGIVWKSGFFPHLINGMAIGDVNNDNLMETVIISDHSLFIYQASGERFVRLAEVAHNNISTYISVDIGDINGNGTPEIFVTSLTPEKNALNSFVIEYSGKSYKTLEKRMPWYFRVTNPISSKPVLIGQKQKKIGGDIYSNPIYMMRWNGKTYVDQEKLIGPNKSNVLGVAPLYIEEKNRSALLAYDASDYLTLLSATGKRLWKDINKSGGSMNTFELSKESPTDMAPIQFYPLPIKTEDLNSDGANEIFYATNQDSTMGMLSKIRSLGKGFITCASWNGSTVVPNWKTPQHAGRISSFLIGDYNNDGIMDLVISEIVEEGLTRFSTTKSQIIAYQIMR